MFDDSKMSEDEFANKVDSLICDAMEHRRYNASSAAMALMFAAGVSGLHAAKLFSIFYHRDISQAKSLTHIGRHTEAASTRFRAECAAAAACESLAYVNNDNEGNVSDKDIRIAGNIYYLITNHKWNPDELDPCKFSSGQELAEKIALTVDQVL